MGKVFCFVLGIMLSSQIYCQIKLLFLDDIAFFSIINERTAWSFYDLADSMPDGTYILYDVLKQDSGSVEKKILLKCSYLNNRKNGLCEKTNYFFGTRKDLCYYSNGQKNGTENLYSLKDNQPSLFLEKHFEYCNGKKDGFFIWYDNKGLIEQISIYRMDTLLERTRYFTFYNSSKIKES